LRLIKAMKRLFLICCIAILALIGLSCTPPATLELSVNETANGVMIKNVGNVDCIVFVKSPDCEKRFELNIGENVTVTDISHPVEVSAVIGGGN